MIGSREQNSKRITMIRNFLTQENQIVTPTSSRRITHKILAKTPTKKARLHKEAALEGVKIINDYPQKPVGGRLLSYRAAWKGTHFESVIQKGLSWSWLKDPPPTQIIDQDPSRVSDKTLVAM